MYDILELSKKLVPELREIAKELNIKKADLLKKQDLIYKILDQQAIDATELKITSKKGKEPDSKGDEHHDSHIRRGKRPRFIKQGGNFQKESVISVSPSDSTRPETKSREWHEQQRKQDQKGTENADQPRKHEHSEHEKRMPHRNSDRTDGFRRKPDKVWTKETSERPSGKKAEPLDDPLTPIGNVEIMEDEIKPIIDTKPPEITDNQPASEEIHDSPEAHPTNRRVMGLRLPKSRNLRIFSMVSGWSMIAMILI